MKSSSKHISFVISCLCVGWIIGWGIYKSVKIPVLPTAVSKGVYEEEIIQEEEVYEDEASKEQEIRGYWPSKMEIRYIVSQEIRVWLIPFLILIITAMFPLYRTSGKIDYLEKEIRKIRDKLGK